VARKDYMMCGRRRAASAAAMAHREPAGSLRRSGVAAARVE
jgi:hypothetical protein